ncbi:MAG: hypothetical protein LBQ20_01970 [Rhodanobacter sp.]|jgi:hypothetical protein|nr:hypothetical protein [Rhodanobacter sp.]
MNILRHFSRPPMFDAAPVRVSSKPRLCGERIAQVHELLRGETEVPRHARFDADDWTGMECLCLVSVKSLA